MFLVEERGGVVEIVEAERLGVVTVDDDCPVGRSVELREKFDDGGFAATVLSDDYDERGRGYGERYVPKGELSVFASGVLEGYVSARRQ